MYYHRSFELTQNVKKCLIRAFIIHSSFNGNTEGCRRSSFLQFFSVLTHLWSSPDFLRISEKEKVEFSRFIFIVNHCQQLYAPPHGSLEHCSNLPGQTCEFSCNKGYILTGSTTRTCNSNGTWTGTPTQCNGNRPQSLFSSSVMILGEGL